ncbi:hypothetical protein [Constantimarinum furrinae]|uniref:Membrane protein n=1 Tax=Constantimarinum furrinae TaxID=2562285 RepID=A0A7G8PXX0_9FLAO|nr:hypothetical protein [Constantimarinum furrinae]QNJ99186.1 membrane protein [Constantimarinum furrinae]
MFPKTRVEEKLSQKRNKRISSEAILKEVYGLFAQNDKERSQILNTIRSKDNSGTNNLNVELLDADRIYHLEDIRALCVEYRLRFLDTHFFKGTFPEEAISEIRRLEKAHNTRLKGFKIIAPSKLLKLENADDPLLFVPLGHDYFYFIHKWGNDLHPFRKLQMWPYRSFENLVFTIFLLSILLTAITPVNLFSHTASIQEYVLTFLFMFKAVGGIVLFYGFAKGKNFNNAIWDSKYYNA